MSQKKRHRRRATTRLYLILGALCAVLLGAGGYMWIFHTGVPDQKDMQVVFDTGTIVPGISINGVEVGNMTPAQARVAINDQVVQKAQSLALQLQYADRVEELPAENIGVYPNADDTIREAMLEGRQGSIAQRKSAMSSGTVKALTLSYVYDENSLEDNIRAAIPGINTDAIEPSVEVGEDGTLNFVEGKDGIELDEDAFVALVKEAVTSGEFGTIAMPGTAKKATYTIEEIKAHTVLVASATTSYSDREDSGRAKNIVKMAEILNGSVVKPGETFSVNDTAGPRTVANGWYLAKGIENGVYTDQPGGGICQVSSTLYNALLKADLQITARRPHSIPSSYVKRALDAAISTGGPDLAFKNNTDWPVYVMVRAGNGKVTAEIYGQPLPDDMTIEMLSVDVEVEAYDPDDVVVVDDPSLTRKGRNKYVTEAWKIYKDKNGNEIKRVKANTSTYKGSKPYVLATPTPSPTPSEEPETTPDRPGTSQTAEPTAAPTRPPQED